VLLVPSLVCSIWIPFLFLFLTGALGFNGTGSLAARAQREIGLTGKGSLFSRAQSIATGGPFPLVGYAVAGTVAGGVAARVYGNIHDGQISRTEG
jgi:hypothetical protein